MKAFVCDLCKKEPATFRGRIRFSPYFEGTEAVAVKLGDFCTSCAKKEYPEFAKALKAQEK